MRLSRMLALGASALLLVGACAAGGGSSSSTRPTLKIGSDGFYESELMAQIYGQAAEAQGFPVDFNGLAMGARAVTTPALLSGKIDMKPEYIGSGLSYFEKGKATGDPAANEAALQAVLKTQGGGITVLNYTPAQDQNAFVVRQATATQYNLTTMSQLAPIQNQLKWGLATDCPTNPVCGAALKSAYGISPTNVTYLDACSTPMAQALAAKTIDVGELCSTQPDIVVDGFVVLQDDKQTQPADNIAPLVRDSYLNKLSSADRQLFDKTLNDVSAKMTTTMLTELGKQIAVDHQDIAAVAKSWLTQEGLLK